VTTPLKFFSVSAERYDGTATLRLLRPSGSVIQAPLTRDELLRLLIEAGIALREIERAS
jgi:hypothetical protein